MTDTLAEIVAHTRGRVAAAKAEWGPGGAQAAAHAAPPPRAFAAALAATRAQGRPALIAEVKRASPSQGLIRADFDPATLARAYADGGATCLSVLTEPKWFKGDPGFLLQARDAVGLPDLRKDFIVDEWQIAESRALGADCVLLIVAALADEQLHGFAAAARALGMDVLVEAHDADEVARAVAVPGALIGINNRDLRSLSVNPMRGLALARAVPSGRVIVAESGLSTPADLARYLDEGIGCFLVGEALMRQADVTAATRHLLGTQ